ncbi:hypothetical protein FG167_08435 [Lacinutrix sp. WUR7]|uniref:hypothetical protein n=1 Tax=Lacinutrix sp. WUR7 TaxID=2653681 RepID=UPI00193E5E3E|nr:hypothetical protein [Lacinutrix sp. WUR7]QRM89258.1 hypothetical protein FG167_08435 [Lacinutrix sp. WUR7]
MAPIKFEENIKEKLEKRTLPPSENAWHRLEGQLNADAKKQTKNKFWWFGVAASFIGLLFVVQQFITQDNNNTVVSPVVVETENEVNTNSVITPAIIKESQEIVQETSKEISKENIKEANKNSLATTNTRIKNTRIKKTETNNRKEKSKVSIAVAQTKDGKASKELITNLKVKDEGIASVVKTEGVLGNKENQLVSTSLETTDSEIEALLAVANKKVQLQGNRTVNTVSVDANALLEDVETEMPPSLRGQIFKVIEKNFKTATTAVITRNE